MFDEKYQIKSNSIEKKFTTLPITNNSVSINQSTEDPIKAESLVKV